MCGAGPRAAVTRSDAWDFRAPPRGPFRNVRGGSGGRFVCFFSVTEVSLLSRYRAVNGLPVREAEMSLDDVKLQLHDCHPGPLSCVASVLDRDSGRGALPGLAGHAWVQAADGGRGGNAAPPPRTHRVTGTVGVALPPCAFLEGDRKPVSWRGPRDAVASAQALCTGPRAGAGCSPTTVPRVCAAVRTGGAFSPPGNSCTTRLWGQTETHFPGGSPAPTVSQALPPSSSAPQPTLAPPACLAPPHPQPAWPRP